MTKFATKIFGSPYFLRELLFAGKYAALLQFGAALTFFAFSRLGGPLGCLSYGFALAECALTTMTLVVCTEILALLLRRGGIEF